MAAGLKLLRRKVRGIAMHPRWMKLKDATRYSAIGKTRLIGYAKSGAVDGFQDPDDRNAWVFDRLSIDSFRESQNTNALADKTALEIWESVS